jgi:hypothetical protein
MFTRHTKKVEKENKICRLCLAQTYKLVKTCDKHFCCEGCKETIKKIYFGRDVCIICIKTL